MPTPLEEMRLVARRLQPLNVPFVFVGGAVMHLLVDYPQLTQFRPTKDVDVIVGAIVSYNQFAQFEERLRQNSFCHDTSAGAPICRWLIDGCRVDIMPENPANLGMNTRWFPETLRSAVVRDLGDGCSAPIISRPFFIATKLEAFKDRGKNDFYRSHDLEDIITLADGARSIVGEIAASEPPVKDFIAREFAAILAHPDFRDALPGHCLDSARIPVVLERFQSIAKTSQRLQH